MTRAPYVMAKPDAEFPRGGMELYDTTIGWRFTNEKLKEMYGADSMPQTAENIAKRFGITRKEQDEFAFKSQQRAKRAQEENRFEEEIVPVVFTDRRRNEVVFNRDEHPRPQSTIDQLANLQPLFPDGTVTAGNASGVNDGASALLLMSAEKAEQLGCQPLVKYIVGATAGLDPAVMGLGPIDSTEKALQRANLTVNDIDLIELNEAFASQAIQCMRELQLNEERVNVNGGAIAFGHPLGASGARILTTLIYEMKKRKSTYGLATMCVGVGQGISVIVENVSNRR